MIMIMIKLVSVRKRKHKVLFGSKPSDVLVTKSRTKMIVI